MKSKIILVVVLVLVALLLMAFVKPWQPKAADTAAARAVPLSELGVSVSLPEGLTGLAVATSTTPGLGTVVHLAIPATDTTQACELGVYYDVQKSTLGTPEARWTKEQLDAAAVVNGQVPPQAKEFEWFYFVFEPTQATCATDTAQVAVENSLRQALWIGVATAVQIPGTTASVGIEEYVRAHISDLSPVDPVLGGTFMVTDVVAANGAGKVSYEDGHNAHTASFTYTISATGVPSVTNFTVQP